MHMPSITRRHAIFISYVLAALVLLRYGSMSIAADGASVTNVGSKVAPFALTATDGKKWSSKDLKDPKAVVVVFVGNECPVNNAYWNRLAELHKAYKDKGVQFVAINANEQDTNDSLSELVKQKSVPFPLLKDTNNIVADAFAAERTPEAFLLDGTFTIRYRGRIDDQYGVGFKRPAPTRRDLAEAIDELLDGKEISQTSTPVSGCRIGRAPKPKGSAEVTYSKQVSRIMQERCQACHRPGQVGPMSLMTYESARDWSSMIKEVVEDQRMPPWHADPKFGKFTNDRSLSKEERDTLIQWIAQGCTKGDDKDLPAKKNFADGWTIGKPDEIFSMQDEFTVPAKDPGNGIKYKNFSVPTNFTEDKWIQAAECQPGNHAVVHHILVYMRKPGQKRGEDGIGDGLLAAYAPGDTPLVLEPGSAKLLPKGTTLVFQMHYTPTGTEEKDKSSIGLIFAKEPPKYEVRTRAISQQLLLIPPGDATYKTQSLTTFKEDAVILSFFPHMHLRGKSFEYKIETPDGKEETVLSVPKYDFGWQSQYRLEKPLSLPAGTRIRCTAHFDNSKDNPNNPDPTKRIHWGEQTWDEMMIGFVDYAFVREK
jgi:peroxiredoxin